MAITASRRTTMPQRSSAPRGPRANRGRELFAGGRPGARDVTMRDTRPAAAANRAQNLTQLQITGWKDSPKFSANEDGGVAALKKFIERRGTIAQDKNAANAGIKKNSPIRIRKSKVEGDALVISVATGDVKFILSANGYEWGGINIRIELLSGRPGQPKPTFSFGNRDPSPVDTGVSPELIKECINAALGRRYDHATKILDLSNLVQDPDLMRMKMEGFPQTGRSRIFECIMKVCDNVFGTRAQKAEAVLAVSLANNGLKDLEPVNMLAVTFPDLTAVDLTGNNLVEMKNLSRWNYKLKKLEHIVLTNNPIEHTDLTFQRSLRAQFPALITVDNAPIPAEFLIKPTPPKVKPAVTNDVGGVAERFISHFYPAFDNSRAALVSHYYDADSKFSYAVNMKGLRDPSEPKVLPKGEWSAYTRDSRNLSVLNNPNAKIDRLHRGVDAITTAFNSLPATIHPPFGDKWLVECGVIANLPDPNVPQGVNGLRVTVHGEFQEVETQKRRSFDRTFILGPGPNVVRVVSDMMTIRGYGGCSAFLPEAPAVLAVQEAPVLSEAQQKEALVIELSRITGMNMQFSMMCMEEANWVPLDAMAKFEMSRDAQQIPPEAFVH